MPLTGKVVDMNLASYVELTSSLIEKLGRALVELKAHKDASTDKVQWNDVEGHFHRLEAIMRKRLEELEAKEKKFKEKELVLFEKEAAVTAQEQDVLDQVQEMKDAAVDAITEARANPLLKVSSYFNEENASLDARDCRVGENAEGLGLEVNPRSELTQFCERMDSKRLLRFVMENLKDLSAVRRELLPIALRSATKPARLVLNALEGFFPAHEMTQLGDDNGDALQGARHSCLVLMEGLSAFLFKAEAAGDNFLDPDTKQLAKAIADEWKPKLDLESVDAANGKSLEVRGFLRLLATFRIASEFDDEELCKYLLAVAHHRQAIELCRSLELTPEVPGIVETLIKKGRTMDAIYFILGFQLSESFPPVPILKTYLKELRKDLKGNGDPEIQNEYNAQELNAVRTVIRCVKEYKLDAEYPLDPLRKRLVQLQNSIRDRKRKRDRGKRQQQSGSQGDERLHGTLARDPGGGRQGPLSFSERAPPQPPAHTLLPERYSPTLPSVYSYPVSTQPPYTAETHHQIQSAYSYPVSSQPPYTAQAFDQSAYSYPVSSQPRYGNQTNDQRSNYYAQDPGVSASYSGAAPSYGAHMQQSHPPYL